MIETPFFFTKDRCRLFGVLHEPEGDTSGTGFVLCSPFAEEKLWVHRVFVSFARALAREGYPVLRFDHEGHGDSDGEFADATVESRLSDIATATAYLKTSMPSVTRVGLLGLRLGGTLAALAAERDPNYSHLVLWEPLVSGTAYVQELLRINLATQMAAHREIRHTRQALIEQLKQGERVNIDGYEIGKDFYEQLSRIDLLAKQKTYPGPVLIVNIARKPGPPSRRLASLEGTYRHVRCATVVEQPFWKEIREYYAKADSLFECTMDWLRTRP